MVHHAHPDGPDPITNSALREWFATGCSAGLHEEGRHRQDQLRSLDHVQRSFRGYFTGLAPAIC